MGDWIRRGKPSKPEGPTGEFERIDQMLPPKKNQSPDDRAKDIEGVLNWMRTNNVPVIPPVENEPGTFDTLSSIPINKRSPEDREKDVDDVTNWIRQGKPSKPEGPTGEFERIDQM